MTKNLRLALALAGSLATIGAASARADADAAQERATSFRSVQGAVTEDVPGAPLLVTAYALIWVGVLAYVFRIARLQARSMAELQELSRQIHAKGGGEKPEA